jgi:hypothetical protein
MERAKMSSVSDQSIYFAEFKMSRIWTYRKEMVWYWLYRKEIYQNKKLFKRIETLRHLR